MTHLFIFPTKIIKRNAIDLSYWFEMQGNTPAARAPPRFEQVFDDIKHEFTQWEPTMSPGFLKELKLETLGVVPRPNPSVTPGVTPRDTPVKVPKDTGLDDAAASNPHFLESVFGEYRKLNKVRTRQIRRKIAEKELPALPLSKVDHQPVCLAWHTKGQCNARCPRAADHVAYTAEEANELATWCATNYPKE
jgi:hypothetical protein